MKIFDNIIRQIAEEQLTRTLAESLQNFVKSSQQRVVLQKQIDAPQTKIQKEKLLNR